MSFLAPAALIFALALPVVVLFYLLKRKRVIRLVPSTLLWQRFLAETQASAPFQKLRKNWLLILQLLMLALLVFGLARPYFAAKLKPAQLRVVILDASASMKSTDEKPSRFEKARAEALAWVNGLAGTDQMVVLLAGANTEVKQSATSSKAALRRAIESCSPSDSPTRLTPALRMAESLVRDQRDAEIHLFSDGAAAGLEVFENKALPLVYHRLGKSSENLGIVALDVRANPENPRQRAVYVSVSNFGTHPATSELELLLDGRTVQTRAVTVQPAEPSAQVFIAEQRQDGVFTARLTEPDELAADNEASIVSALPRPASVLLVTRGNAFLEKALRAVPSVRLTVGASLNDEALGFDFVILDQVEPTVWPRRNVLAVRVAHPTWFTGTTPVTAPPIVDWRQTHPLLRYSGLENVQVVSSLTVKPPPWAISLADAPAASLMLAGELAGQRIVWLGFDLLESNWPLRISFPIFVANAVEWLNPANVRSAQLMVKAGDAFRMLLTEPPASATVTLPNGDTRNVAVEKSAGELVFADTQQQGVYRLKLGTNTLAFCVNLLDPAESDTKPRDELRLGQYEKVQATTLKRANMEVWRTFAGLALLVVLFEWWYYHKRTA